MKNLPAHIINPSAIILMLFAFTIATNGQSKTTIFPFPQEMEQTDARFTLDEEVVILIPQHATENDLILARALTRELSDKYGIALKSERISSLQNENRKYILMGTIDNPLVNNYCRENGIEVTKESPGPEGYILNVENHRVVVAGWDDRGAFYGLQSLRQLVRAENGFILLGLNVRDWPEMPFRAIRLYIPGPENIAFFKRFISDFMALYKYNKVMIEVNCMRLHRHPEVNAGLIEFAKYMKYTRTSELLGIHGNRRNSAHYDAGDGMIIEQDDVKRLVKFCEENYLEVIPEIPSLTHGYYLLTRHPELAEYKEDIWPDTYCPSNPATYELMFDVLDEYISVMDPKMINIGHDEWWGAPLGVCSLCKDQDYSDLFAKDINMLHGYLKKRGIEVSMWGDYLLESVRGKGPWNRTSETGMKYQTPGGIRPEVVRESIPKDILLLNWTWGDPKGEVELADFGFKQIYGNMKPYISNWEERIQVNNVVGGAPSAWASTNEFTTGKDLVMDYLGSANMLWSGHALKERKLREQVWGQLPVVRRNLRGYNLPGDDGDPVETVDISPSFNMKAVPGAFEIDLASLKAGEVSSGTKFFRLPKISSPQDQTAIVAGVHGPDQNPFAREVTGIKIDEDVSSLIFLHACARPAGNQKSYFDLFDMFDTADLLGWYEIVYEDDYKEIIPIQYGVNILEWNPLRDQSASADVESSSTGYQQNAYCYHADAVNCSTDAGRKPIQFYAFEWTNKRFGKKIKEVNLIGSDQYKAVQPVYSHVETEPLSDNAILLLGISKVLKREIAPWR